MDKIKNYIRTNKKNLEIILKIIISYLITLSFNIMSGAEKFTIYNLFLFILLSICLNKIKIHKSKKYNLVELFLAIIFSSILIIGRYVMTYHNNNTVNIFKEILKFKNFILFLGLASFLFISLNYLFNKLRKFNFKESNINKLTSKKVFIISFIVIIVCWLPFFFNFYPAIMSGDTIGQFRQIVGDLNYSNHHPIFHTLFMGLIFNFGKLFVSSNNAIAFVTVTQMIILALIFSFLIKELYKRGVNKIVLTIIVLFYGLSSVNGFYSVTLWKDILFGGVFLLFSCLLYFLYEKRHNLKLIDYVLLAILSLLMMLLRNNALYIFLFSIPFIILLFKKIRIKISITLLISLFAFMIIQGPIFKAFNISKSSSAESLAIPLQIMGRMAYKDVNFTDEEEKLINDLIPIEVMRDVYDPTTVDSIKFNMYFKIDAYNLNKFEYFKLWFNLFIEHPSIALEGYLASTAGYWYPNISYWAVFYGISPSTLKYHTTPIMNIEAVTKAEETTKAIPVINLQWSIGLCFWLILISATLTYLLKGKRYLCFYAPVLGLWITMMIASPVFAEFRYIYGAFVSLPFLMIMPFLKTKK